MTELDMAEVHLVTDPRKSRGHRGGDGMDRPSIGWLSKENPL